MISVFALVLLGSYWNSVPVMAQGSSNTEKMLRAVADAVRKEAAFQFVDQKSGQRFDSPEQAPVDAILRPASPYSDWRYWNGVLNLAMIRLGEALDEPAYIELARKNIAFSFDNYRFFKNKYKGESKWEYPFGQFFI